jgi:hypothetical protein
LTISEGLSKHSGLVFWHVMAASYPLQTGGKAYVQIKVQGFLSELPFLLAQVLACLVLGADFFS